MKRRIVSLVAFLTVVTLSCAQYQTLIVQSNTSQAISIPAGRTAEILNFVQWGDLDTSRITVSNNPILFAIHGKAGQENAGHNKSLFLAGPIAFRVESDRNFKICTFRLLDNATNTAPLQPSTAVVIPADATGPVDIVLESSTDLISWTSASPGTYGSSTERRFFRVRAIQK